MTPSVSVVIPTFNRRALVVRAVQTVLAQTFRDFEIVVVDDASTDGTEAALARLQGPIRYIRRETNGGVSSARNEALRAARAPLVAFLDSDNRWLPDHLAVATDVLALHPEAVLSCTCPRFLVAGRERPGDAVVVDPLPRLLVNNFVGYISCVVVHRHAIETVGGFDERMQVAEDSDLWVRLALVGPFAFVQRRTTRIQATRDSLRARGRRSGAYLDAVEQSYDGIVEAAGRAPDRGGISRRARGGRDLIRALRALDAGDEQAVARSLASACALFPDLSAEAGLVAGRIALNLPTAHIPEERLRLFATAAKLWPDQRAETAVALRGRAVLSALRLGRVRTAARLAAGLPFRPTLTFATRTGPPVLLDLARRRLGEFRGRGRESADVLTALGGSAGKD